MSSTNREIKKKIAEIERRRAAKRKANRKKRKAAKLVSAPPRKKKKRRRRTASPSSYAAAKKLYGTVAYKNWRIAIFERDSYQCQMCGQRGGALEAHHIRPKRSRPELTLVEDNGICLCRFCHQDRVTHLEEHFIFIFDRIVRLNKARRNK